MPVSGTRRMMTGGWGSPKIDIKAPVFYAPLWRPDMVAKGGTIVNGTGICTGSPLYLAVGANTVDVTQAGTFTVTMPEGGTVASGTMTVDGSPVTISAGLATTVTTSGATGDIACTVSNIIRSKDKNNFACTVTDALWTPQGRQFDLVDDQINCGNATVLQLSSPFTVFAWIKCTTFVGDVNEYAISKGDLSTDGFHIYACEDDTWRMFSGTAFVDGPVVSVDSWICLALRDDGVNLILFANGVSYDGEISGSIANTTKVLRLGKYSSGNNLPFGGVIGDVIICGRGLEDFEIMRLYNATKWRYAAA